MRYKSFIYEIQEKYLKNINILVGIFILIER